MSSGRGAGSSWRACLIGLALGCGVVLLFSRCVGFNFVDFDDPGYVYENPQVLRGISFDGFRWAWTTFESANWHPLTWLSLQLDASLTGSQPRGFHLTNILLHAAAAAMLFAALLRLTRTLGPSLAVALLFAIHPLRVESVAWISERKDVLSVFWGTVALWCYAAYVENRSWWRGSLVLATFTLSLLAKPMLVTLPCVLMLLDYWPLNRFRDEPWRRLVLEKIPFLVLAIGSAVLTVLAQSRGGALSSETRFPLEMRLANAALATMTYLRQSFWPFDLAAFYPHSQAHLTELRVWMAIAVLSSLTFVSLRLWRQAPWFTVGWLWFLGTLVPVLGVSVQQGVQGHADRYTYWPHIGLWIAVVWGLTALVERWQIPQLVPRLALVAAVLLLSWRTFQQAEIWRDTEGLWRHTLAVTGHNAYAEAALGQALVLRGDRAGGLARFRKGVAYDPGNGLANNNLGALLLQMDELDEAGQVYRRLLSVSPNNIKALNGLGSVLVRQGRDAEARVHFERVLQIKPDFGPARYNLGLLMSNPLEIEQAQKHFELAIQGAPQLAELHSALAETLEWQERDAEAEAEFREALRLDPDDASAVINLPLLLARSSRSREALPILQQGLARHPDAAKLHLGLGLVYETLGDATASASAYQRARELDPQVPLNNGRAAWLMAVHPDSRYRRPQRAAAMARQLIGVYPKKPEGYEILAAALAASGDFAGALSQIEKAILLSQDRPELLPRLEQERQAFREKRPWIDQSLLKKEASRPAQ